MGIFPKHCYALAAAVAMCLAFSSARSAHAATFNVNSTGDTPDAAAGNGVCADSSGVCTLRAAIQEANGLAGADTINISATGTINLTGALPDLSHGTKINGPGSTLLTVRRDTGGDYRIFTALNVNADISGLTITNGRTLDGAPASASPNGFAQTGQSGGGIHQFGVMTLIDVVITGNSTGNGGLGPSQPFARGGGGGFGGGISGGGTLTMINCVVSGNFTGRGGAGGYGGTGGFGGGIAFSSGTLTMTNVTVAGNRTGGSDGALISGQRGGEGGFGGGLYAVAAPKLTMTNVVFDDNSTGGTDNGSAGWGGAMHFGSEVNATLTHSTVSNNRTGSSTGPLGEGGHAGGISSHSALSVTNSTISGNSTGSGLATGGIGGGGFHSSTFVLTNTTVTANTAHSGRGHGLFGNDATIRNTIIAGNGPAGAPDVFGNFNSQGHNLVGNGEGSTGFTSVGDTVGSGATPVDAKLGPLAANGGPTRTHALLAGSPALDAGSNALAADAGNNSLADDQRGAARVRPAVSAAGIVDIGAFEFQPSLQDIADRTTNEDIPATFSFGIGDAHPAAPTVTATSGNQSLVPDGNLSLNGDGPVRSVTVTPAPNQTGAAVITVTVTPPGGPAASDTFILTVAPVNDAPTFAKGAGQTIAEDSGPQTVTGWASGISPGAADESGQSLSFQITGNTNPALFSAAPSLGPSGVLTYTPAADANGSATLTVVLKDDGGTANGGRDTSDPQTFQINVTAINDAPVNTVPGPQTVAENNALLFFAGNTRRVAVSDVDSQANAVAVTLTAANGSVTLGRTTGLSFVTGDGAGDATMTFTGTISNVNFALDGMSFNPTNGYSGAASLTLSADDQGHTGAGGALTATNTVNITVEDGGAFQFGLTSYSVAENLSPATITVTRAGGSAGFATVRYTTSNGTAAAGSDYVAANVTLSFSPGETSKTFGIVIVNDTRNEADETINMTLGTVGGSGALGSPAAAVLSVINDDTPTVQFKDAGYIFNEGDQRAVITVIRGGDRALPAAVKFLTVDDPAAVPCDPTATRGDGSSYPQGVAFARCDYATTIDTVTFAAGQAEKQIAVPLIDDVHVDGVEIVQLRLSEPQGAALGTREAAALTITDNDPPGQPNPVRANAFFVRQHYLDFLSREPEAGEPWTGVLGGCADVFNTDPNSPSAGCDRNLVSGAFFQSPEFQLKGLYTFLFYKAAFGRMPEYSEIVPDMRSVTGQTSDEVFQKRASFAASFAQRAEFTQLYGPMSNAQYVDALLGRYNAQQITTENPQNFEGASQVTLTRQALTDALNSNSLTRAQALRAVVQSSEADAAEYHGAFVAMQYYGYLRRTPEQPGYDAWLRVIRQDPSNVRVMIDGFMNSQEYALRFGKP